jgi:hypothetical protein
VVGRNTRLFDYFLPERWRKTHSWKLSEDNEVYYTFTKDHIHIVWKTSRVGEHPPAAGSLAGGPASPRFNSPFEEAAIARFLTDNGVPTVYLRAIYVTGSHKVSCRPTCGPTNRTPAFSILTELSCAPTEPHHRGYFTHRCWGKSAGEFAGPRPPQGGGGGFIAHADYRVLTHPVRLGTWGYDGSPSMATTSPWS